MTGILDHIRRIGVPKRYPRGSHVFKAGEAADGFYAVQKGGVRVYKLDGQGRELDVDRLQPGDFLGEAVAFAGGAFPFFAQATEDADVYYFDRAAAWKAVESDAAAARFFIGLLARKCVVLSHRVESLGLQTVRQRLIQYLLNNCSGESRCIVHLKFKKGELAVFIGTVAETLSRNLKQLQEDGLIDVRGSTIRIENCPKLRDEITG